MIDVTRIIPKSYLRIQTYRYNRDFYKNKEDLKKDNDMFKSILCELRQGLTKKQIEEAVIKKNHFLNNKNRGYFNQELGVKDNRIMAEKGYIYFIPQNIRDKIKNDVKKAFQKLRAFEKKTNHPPATRHIASCYLSGYRGFIPQNHKNAIKFYKKGHDVGDIYCTARYSFMLDYGLGCKMNTALAFKLQKKVGEFVRCFVI